MKEKLTNTMILGLLCKRCSFPLKNFINMIY